MGAAWIAGKAVLPALASSSNGRLVAIAARDPARARELALQHGVARVHQDYGGVLADREVDAVYIPLANGLHRKWVEEALAAGKHVLCEKPLATTAADAEAMAAASGRSGGLLMEALMYRFHPRLTEQIESLSAGTVRHVASYFGFRLDSPDNYRLRPELGGGALLDVGCYTLDLCRRLLGEPNLVAAVTHLGPTGVDLTVAASMRFEAGATAFAWGSFESPEHQLLEVLHDDGVIRILEPFTAWRDPDDPYQLMVEAFGRAVLDGTPAPHSLSESIATARLVESVKSAADGARISATLGAGPPVGRLDS